MTFSPPPSHKFLQRLRHLLYDLIKTRIPFLPTFRISIPPSDLIKLIHFVTLQHQTEPATLLLSGNHYIVGDIHGNVDILIRVFESFGYPPTSKYLFLGDYIDRGHHSCEVILILYILKLLFPDHLHLLRGNHEFFLMSDFYGFRRECEARLSRSVYTLILKSFDSLPIAARIGGNYCVHGGISPKLMTAESIRNVEKLNQTEEFFSSPSYDLLWSDPRSKVSEFGESPRGCGVLFGREAAIRFLRECPGVFRIIRSHESCNAGVDWPFLEGGPVLTVFSSCDYCQTGNDAGVVAVTDWDDSVRCSRLPPLVGKQIEKRRVMFPEWLINDGLVFNLDCRENDESYLKIEI